MTELGCSTHCIKKKKEEKEPNDFVNVSPPPSGNFPLEFQDEAELVCTWSAWNELLLATVPPFCGQVSFPGRDGKYGSAFCHREGDGEAGVPGGFKAPFACGGDRKQQICKGLRDK
ncbi:hypothetical protein VZT92_018659 [Zoarces viviparus]|uniref:Uncharacterized protein n=1 Tax=Zoarces viviparus TaxID=48416 RepID=A0AAW1EIX5_ZOAVI